MPSRKSKPPQLATRELTDLDQVRVLADPLRIRIVEAFCEGEFTTKQVAERLGEKPTKLYHHVDALLKVGLIRQTRTKRNRGTLERYYIAVARSFRASSDLFRNQADPEDAAALRSMIDSLLGRTRDELNGLIDVIVEKGADVQEELGERGVVSFCEIRADREQLEKIQQRIMELLADIQALDDGDEMQEASETDERYRLTLTYYPLDPPV